MFMKKSLIIGILLVLTGFAGIFMLGNSSGKSEKQYALAEKLYVEKNYPEAYAAFLKINVFSPCYKPALFKQAVTAEKTEDWKTAKIKYDRILRFFPDSIFESRALYSAAKCRYMLGEYSGAKKRFLKIADKSDVKDYKIAADYFLGEIALKENNPETAAEHFEKYLSSAPDGRYSLKCAYYLKDMNVDQNVKLKAGNVFFANGKFAEARSVFVKLPEKDVYARLAVCEFKMNKVLEFNGLMKKIYSEYLSSLSKEDFKLITDFYLSLPGAKIETLDKMLDNKKYSGKDYFLYKKATLSDEQNAIKTYKILASAFTSSDYTKIALKKILLFDLKKNDYAAVAITAQRYLNTFKDDENEAFFLYMAGDSLSKTSKPGEAAKYFKTLTKKYPDDYYAFRAERYGLPIRESWAFGHEKIVENPQISAPINVFQPKHRKTVEYIVSIEDYTIWDEIPDIDTLFGSWVEYKKGHPATSIYLAEKYLKENRDEYKDIAKKLAYPIYYSDEINAKCTALNLDCYLMLSLIREESHFIPNSRSSSGARGLMQLMPPTAAYISAKRGVKYSENMLSNPEYSIDTGTEYFKYLMKELWQFPMYATGAYNGGPNALKSWLADSENLTSDDFVEKIPYEESANYIKKVYKSRYNYEKIYGSGR